MHIAEGILSAPVLAAGVVLSAGGVAIGLRRMDADAIPKVAVLSSAFFVASLIHVPIGPVSTHLLLNGLVGLLLGWAAFPAILVALLLQALLFGFGGLTTLGVNTFSMAGSALACYYLLGRSIRRGIPRNLFPLGFAAGALAVALSATIVSAALVLSGREFAAVAGAVLMAQVPVMVVEGVVTGFALVFFAKVRPQILNGATLRETPHEGSVDEAS